MKILVTGNLGYVGPTVIRQLRKSFPDANIVGFDAGYFLSNITGVLRSSDSLLNAQYYGDVRLFQAELLHGVNVVVHLAAISNDPIGNQFEQVTMDVNYKATIEIAKMAKDAGVNKFVFASSCSVYGTSEVSDRKETSSLNPLTAYAKSKVLSEEGLASISSDKFNVTCLRFATACGMSERLRLDLVVNDFVAGAFVNKRIDILSDGSPWRPLIDTKDMALAIEWATLRDKSIGGNSLVVNVGNNLWNFQVKDIAETISRIIPGITVSLNKNASPDKRSYKVNFDLYHNYAGNYQLKMKFESTIFQLVDGLKRISFENKGYRDSEFIRLNFLNKLKNSILLDENLFWKTV